MTDTAALFDIIDRSGLKLKFIASQIGLSYQGFKNKLDNKSDFTATEINRLCDLLNITDLNTKDRIFFARPVDLKST